MDHVADLYNGTASTFFPLGDQMFPQLLEDLRQPRNLSFYVIEKGLMWNSILDIPLEKVKEGVEVMLYDDIGCAGNYTRRLRAS